MSRDDMLRVIQGGGSVLIGNAVIAHPAHLPSEAELAKGDTAASEAVKRRLTGEMARIAAEMETLEREDERASRTTGFLFGDDGLHVPPPAPDQEALKTPAAEAAATELEGDTKRSRARASDEKQSK